MKTIKHIILLALVTVSLLSCQEFLDDRPEATAAAVGVDYSKSDNIFLSVSAAYASLRDFRAHVFPYIGMFEVAGDNADKGSDVGDNPPMKEFDEMTFTSANGLINDYWEGCYNIVAASNYAIHEMPKFVSALKDESDRQYALQCQAEAKVIRAYIYFNLVRVFGRPYISDTIYTAAEINNLPQATTAEVYAFIHKDLNEALGLLPAGYSKEWAGRINKFTAMGIKAKIHLYQGQYDSVAYYTDQIIASARYDLLPDFRTVFRSEGENSKESLFEIQSSLIGKTSGDAPTLQYAYVQGPRGNGDPLQGWGFCVPSQNLIDFLTARGDIARAATTLLYRGTKTLDGDSIKAGCTNPCYNGKVYTPASENKWAFNSYGMDYNIRILRYSDVLLMHAEALTRGAGVALTSGMTAVQAVDKVRQRAGLSTPGGYIVDDILDERRAELAMEEDRYFDLIRTGKARSVLGAKFVVGKNEVYPIPSNARQLNLNLQQNPGYD